LVRQKWGICIMNRFRLLACVMSILGIYASVDARSVTGSISTQTWDALDSPFYVTGPCTVATGETLTINPGVQVLFDVDVRFVVEGSLQAIGDSADMITFTPNLSSTWQGIKISGQSDNMIHHVLIAGSNASNGGGIAIYGSGTYLDMNGVILENNEARNGGAMDIGSAQVYMANCDIRNNKAGSGGAIFISSGQVYMENCDIRNNNAGSGGAMFIRSGQAYMENCDIRNNIATYMGGAFKVGEAKVTLDNVSIVGNDNDVHTLAKLLLIEQIGDVTLNNVTAVYDMAETGSVSGIINYGKLRITNSIIRRYHISHASDPAYDSLGITITYSNIGGSWPGVGNINADPLFVDPTSGDYHLKPGSPCIDTGDPASPLDPDGTRADMGAFPFNDDGSVGTAVAGLIGTETWTEARSPYYVTDQCTVGVGETLTIEPGVEVEFTSDVPFRVEGSVQAIGSESNNIFFTTGAAGEWGGIKISGGMSSTLDFVDISGGNADAPDGESTPDNSGGGIHVSGAGTSLDLRNSNIANNQATAEGGGLCVDDNASVMVENCVITDNTARNGGGVASLFTEGPGTTLDIAECKIRWNSATGYGGGVYSAGTGAALTITRCEIMGNDATNGGGVLNYISGATITNCTIAGNVATTNGGALHSSGNEGMAVVNSILWNNGSDEVSFTGTLSVTYSDIQGGFEGIGNINADPLFVDADSSDYRLTSGSPCIDAGDPTSPLDPDGTRANMGVIFHGETPTERFSLPSLTIGQNVPELTVDVRATFENARSVQFAFTFDSDVIVPTTFEETAFDGLPGATIQSNVKGDTVIVAMVVNEEVTLLNEVLIRMTFDNIGVGISPLTFLPEYAEVDDTTPSMLDGQVDVGGTLYGDASEDGTVSAFDVTVILRWVVEIVDDINTELADVSGNAQVSAYDAALVLYSVVNPDYVFPVQGGAGIKLAIPIVPTVAWERSDGTWRLCASNTAGIISGEISLRVPNGASINGSGALVINRQGDVVSVAFARVDETPILLCVDGGFASAPEILSGTLNDVPVALSQTPMSYALHQNAPNPFNPSTTIRFTVAQNAPAKLAIYNTTGQLVRTLVDGSIEAGAHEIRWDGMDNAGRLVASGVYIYRLQSSDRVAAKRLTLVR
jgi:hypothetical protein